MNSASKNYLKKYNCAESIIKSINDEFNLDIPISMGSALGSGMSVGNVCGAISASTVIIGLLKGRKSNLEVNEAKLIGKEFMNDFFQEFGTYNCIELKKTGNSCSSIVDFSDNYLKEYFKNNLKIE